jgi:hypothetical protein
MDTPTKKIEDSIAKIDEELAVGEDLSFQRKWWSFEKWIWRLFALIVLADLLGAFGRGPLANASKSTSDRALVVHYERIERFSTPSILKINVGPSAVDHGEIRLWVSTSVISRLGNQRIIPEPSSSQIVKGPDSLCPAARGYRLLASDNSSSEWQSWQRNPAGLPHSRRIRDAMNYSDLKGGACIPSFMPS